MCHRKFLGYAYSVYRQLNELDIFSSSAVNVLPSPILVFSDIVSCVGKAKSTKVEDCGWYWGDIKRYSVIP